MYAFLIALASGAVAGFAARLGGMKSTTGCVLVGAIVLLAVVIVISLILRSRIKKVNDHIQDVMQAVQHKLQLKQNQFMRRPMGSYKVMMQAMEKEQSAGIRQALGVCDEFKPYYRWSFLLNRQINTMKMAFNFQLKNFEEVDALMPKCLIFDAQSMSIKMARMYMRKDEGIDKFFKKKCSALKEPACILPIALYSWILVKQERYDDALKVLADAKKKTDNEVILHNWEAIANKKYKSFSNAGLAETWYALGLEEPRMPKMQQQMRYR